jgi:4-hydroxybenzoate polyprenyltransferase
MRTPQGLLTASHPLPSAAVTAFITAYAWTTGLSPTRAALLAAAVLTGQLSIGWCNDAIDAGKDIAAGRRDKPIARAQVGRRAVARAAITALVVCVPLSLALGLTAGVIHLVAVASAWAYDLWLKSTAASGVPYLVAFGLLPAVATHAGSHGGWPAIGVMVGAALLGLAAHFANTVGDTVADAVTGVRGLPQRIGPRGSLVVTAALVALAGVVLITGTPHHGPIAVVVLSLGAVLAVAAVVLGARMVVAGRTAFRITLVAVALVIAGFLLSG